VGLSATALVGGLDYSASERCKASTRLEGRRTDDNPNTPAVELAGSLLHTMNLACKIDRDWTGLTSHYYALTNTAAVAGKQAQQRVQVGAAYRPVDNNKFDALSKLEFRDERNSELIAPEFRKVWVASLHGNYHPARPWWISGRVAGKRVNESVQSAASNWRAGLVSGRLTYDLTEKWDVGAMSSWMRGGGNTQSAYGLETGYTVARNLWLSVGYNWAGFRDVDLTGAEYTAKGTYVRLRWKFDENLFESSNKEFNRALDR
jgi:hypothetical protein